MPTALVVVRHRKYLRCSVQPTLIVWPKRRPALLLSAVWAYVHSLLLRPALCAVPPTDRVIRQRLVTALVSLVPLTAKWLLVPFAVPPTVHVM